MKKILAIILALAAAVCCLTVSTSAAEPFTVDVSAGTYTFGTGTLTASVSVSGTVPSSGFGIGISYPDYLTIKSESDVVLCGEASSLMAVINPGNPLYVQAVKATNVNLSGTILTITFAVDETNLTPTSDLSFSVVECSVTYVGDAGPAMYTPETDFTVDPSKENDKITLTCTAHDFALKSDAEGHWNECTKCGYKEEKANHETDSEFKCVDGKCKVCGYAMPHTEEHKYDGYENDADQHWQVCSVCGNDSEKEAHNPDSEWHNEDASVDGHYHICTVCKAVTGTEKHVDEDLDGTCDVCKASLHEHIADDSKWLSNGEYHYHACKAVEGCTAKLDMTAHTPDTEWHTEEGSAEHWHICTVCGAKIDSTVAKHTYGEYTSTGATEHSHSCTACGAVETAKHNGGEATCTKQAKCADCGAEYGELDKTNHADGVDEKVWKSDGTNHWHVCKYCEAKVGTEAHKGGTATCSKQAVCEVCKAEYGELDKNNHDGVDETVWKSDGENHWHVCANCGEITGVEAHKGGTATCSKQAVCEVCKAEYGELDKNNHDGVDETVWKSDGTNHWHVCANCGEITGTAAHTYTAGEYEHDADGHWQVCTVCKAETEHEDHVKGDMTQDESGHWYKCTSCDEKLEFDAHTKATLTAAVEPYKDDDGVKHDGSLAYWHCPDCGKYFLDNDGKKIGVFDDTSSFTVKYQDDCDDLGHTLTVISTNALSHTYMCTRECGFFWTEAHIFNEYGFCSKCGYKIPGFEETKPEDNVEVDSPTEGTEQGGDSEGDEMNADDIDDTPAEAPAESEPAPAPAPAETNPETGLAMSVIPAILAAIALVVKRR